MILSPRKFANAKGPITFAQGVGTRVNRQAGFSMIEMLMTAFILAVGILGLTALQSVALTAATRSKGYNGAVAVAGHILESIESQARQRWLIITNDSTATLPAYAPDYFGAADITENFTFNGHYPDLSAAANSVNRVPFFTVVTHGDPDLHAVATSGAIRNYTVTVTFKEAGAAGQTAITRTVVLSKTVLYGK